MVHAMGSYRHVAWPALDPLTATATHSIQATWLPNSDSRPPLFVAVLLVPDVLIAVTPKINP
jgi:hypothetical protein